MAGEAKKATTDDAPIADNRNTITAGPSGDVPMQDCQLIEELAHQDRERIPERTVDAKGWRIHGKLVITADIKVPPKSTKTSDDRPVLDRDWRNRVRMTPCSDMRGFTP